MPVRLLGKYEQLLQALCETSQYMVTQVTELMQHMCNLTGMLHHHLHPQVITTESQLVSETHISEPEPTEGNRDKCRGFLLQCSVVFRHPPSFSSDQARVNFVLRLLQGKVLMWAEAFNANVSISMLSGS